MPKEEAENISFIDFGLTGPGLKPTIYRTRGEHTNNYTTRSSRLHFDFILIFLPMCKTGFSIYDTSWQIIMLNISM